MKMIHCADLHLDARLTGNLSGVKRRERQAELLDNFRRLAEYAANQQVEAILIAGDLFDRDVISAAGKNTVRHIILTYPHICFYYLRGNHDAEGFWDGEEPLPDNLKLFDEKPVYHFHPCRNKKVVIGGVELVKGREREICDSLYFQEDCFNILMLHGQESEYGGTDGAPVILLRMLRGKGIDYLALGHIHSFRMERLDERGIWCYPGCLEGRGFDECGERGFVLLDLDEERGRLQTDFIPFARRKLYTVCVDVTGCDSTQEMGDRVEKYLKEAGYSRDSSLKIVLTGQAAADCEKNLMLLQKRFESGFYFVKICDAMKVRIDEQSLGKEASLKGEYIQLIMQSDEIPEEEKGILIRYGILALAGEELE